MSLDIYDVRRAVHGYFGAEDSNFDEWLESHDAEVRAEVMEDVMHDRVAGLTPAELIQCAWGAAYPVPEGRVIPADIGVLRKGGRMITYYEPGVVQGNPVHEPGEFRTLEPLPPLIPEGTPAVWASTSDGILVRRILVNTDHITRQWIDMYDTKYTDEQLIDPAPIPKEERDAE